MTKQADDDQKSIALWDAVIGPLLDHIQYHREQAKTVFNTIDVGPHRWHLKAMRRAAKALALFVDPSDD